MVSVKAVPAEGDGVESEKVAAGPALMVSTCVAEARPTAGGELAVIVGEPATVSP